MAIRSLPAEKTKEAPGVCLFLHQTDDQGRESAYRHRIGPYPASPGWQTIEGLGLLTAETRGVLLEFTITGLNSTLEIRDLRLEPVLGRSAMSVLRWIFVSAWCGYLAYLLRPVFRNGQRLPVAAAALVCGLIVLGTTFPGEIKVGLKRNLANSIGTMGIALGNTVKNAGRNAGIPGQVVEPTKLAHFLLFLAAGVILTGLGPDGSVWKGLAVVFLLAGSTEMIQFFIPGRSPLVMDLMIDAGGGFFVSLPNLLAALFSGRSHT